MCNGESSRVSQGGTIAILKPVQESPGRPKLKRELSLRFAQDSQNGTTRASLDSFDLESSDGQVIIHRDGDLLAGGMAGQSILHSIAVPRSTSITSEGVSFALPQQLDLGVGCDGVIGRRVSFVQGRTLIGQGIIGWN